MMRLAELLLIVGAAVSGLVGLTWYVAVPIGIAGLSISALPKYFMEMPRAKQVGAEGAVWVFVGLSALNSVLAIGLGYLLGMAIAHILF